MQQLLSGRAPLILVTCICQKTNYFLGIYVLPYAVLGNIPFNILFLNVMLLSADNK